MLPFLFPLYIFIGFVLMLIYRWGEEEVTSGSDILLDVVLWPLLLYYWLRYGRY